MILACVGMSWVGVRIREARRQKAVVEQIKKFGGQVGYDYGYQLRHACLIKGTEPLNRKWLRTLLGDDFIHMSLQWTWTVPK